MSVRPLRPDTRPRHGGPLPRRPADGPQTDPVAEPKLLSRCLPSVNSDLSGITLYFYRLSRSAGYVIHVLLTSPPLSALLPAARLAWLRRAASVRSEPGSNSPLFYFKHPEGRLISIILKASPVSFILGTLTFKRKKNNNAKQLFITPHTLFLSQFFVLRLFPYQRFFTLWLFLLSLPFNFKDQFA